MNKEQIIAASSVITTFSDGLESVSRAIREIEMSPCQFF